MANGFSKGQCSRTAEKIGTSEGRAPARPNKWSGGRPYKVMKLGLGGD